MAAITSAAIGVGASVYQISNAEKAKKDARKQIEDFDRQKLENPFRDVQLSTLKAEQQTQANNSNFATSVDALQSGGTRTVLAGLPKLNEANIALQNQISQDLNTQDARRSVLIAQGDAKNQSLQESREINALQGLGALEQSARQDSASGITNLVSAGLSLGSAINAQGTKIPEVKTPDVGVNPINPITTIAPISPIQTNPVQTNPLTTNPAYQNIFGSNDANLYYNNPYLDNPLIFNE
tara:strand:- start:18759 stop:19475 length:717 start_codon:yes stop_codon:yes gene_type:complete